MAESDQPLGVLGGKPVSWQGFENWEERAQRIATMLRQRQEQIRYVGVAGDYALGDVYGASVVTLVVFFHDWRPDYTIGPVQAMEEMPVALDWVTDAFLVEVQPALEDDLRAHRLATLKPLLTLDRVVRDVLVDFRDQYFGHEERAARVERLLGQALQRLSRYEGEGTAVDAVEAFLWGYGPALCHLVDEPPSSRRLLQRFSGAARVLRMRPLAEATTEVFGLNGRDPAVVMADVEALRSLAEAHVRQTRSEAIGGLAPLWASDLAKAGQASRVLAAAGDEAGAVFAALSAATTIDTRTEGEVPGLREQTAYRELAQRIFGSPDVAVLRHAIYEVKAVGR